MESQEQHKRNLEHCKYWAFLSYSHKDTAWSEWLHHALESYTLPRRLVDRQAPDGTIPRRLFPIFRDTAELAVAGSLTQELREALRSARYLIVLCSPAAARSAYVQEEICFFKSIGRSDRILCVIVDGEPNVSTDPARAEQECFPRAARHVVTADGAILDTIAHPIAADARPGKSNRKDVLLRLMAGMLDLSFDDLKRRDRRRMIIQRSVGIFVLLAVILVLAITWQWQEAQKRLQAVESYTSIGQKELMAGNASRAAPFLAEAYRLGGRDLRLRMLLAPALETLDLRRKEFLSGGDEVRLLTFDRAGRRFVSLAGSSRLRLWDIDGNLIAQLEAGDARIEAAAFSPDDRYLLACGLDKQVRVWDTTNGKLLDHLPNHASLLASVAISPDNQHFVTISSDGSAAVWKIGEKQRSTVFLKADYAIRAPAVFSLDGTLLATPGGSGDRIFLWETATGRLLEHPEFHSDVKGLLLAGPHVVAALANGTVEIFDSITRRSSGPLDSSSSPTVLLARLSSEQSFALIKEDGRIELWDAALKRKQMDFWTGVSHVQSVGFDGSRVVLLTNDPVPAFSVWELASGRCVSKVEVSGERLVSAALAPGRDMLVTGGAEGTLRTWSLERQVQDLTLPGHRGLVNVIEFSPDGSRLVTAGWEGDARIWDSKTGRLLGHLDHTGSAITRVQFSPDSSRIVTSAMDGDLGLWDARDYKQLKAIGDLGALELLVASGDDFLVALQSEDRAYLWRPDEGQGVFLDRPALRITKIMLSHDGALLAVGNEDGSVELWETREPRLRRRLWYHQDEITSLSFSGDGRRLLTTAKDGMAIIWSTDEGRTSAFLETHAEGVRVGQLSYDGRMAVTGATGYSVKLWDADRGRVLSSLDDHVGAVTSVAFNPAGTILATGAEDHTVKLWETSSGKLIRSLPPHDGRIVAVAFNRTGELLATAAADSVVRVWDMRPETRSSDHVIRLISERSRFILAQGRLTINATIADLPRSSQTVDGVSRPSPALGMPSPEHLVKALLAALAEGNTGALAQLISSSADGRLLSLLHSDAEKMRRLYQGPFAGATVYGITYREDGRAALITLKVSRGFIDLSVQKTTGDWQINRFDTHPAKKQIRMGE